MPRDSYLQHLNKAVQCFSVSIPKKQISISIPLFPSLLSLFPRARCLPVSIVPKSESRSRSRIRVFLFSISKSINGARVGRPWLRCTNSSSPFSPWSITSSQSIVSFAAFTSFVRRDHPSQSFTASDSAGYFANPLPVEHLPIVSIYGCKDKEGVNISEFADYPLKALLFTSQNLELLVGLVAEIYSTLHHDNNVVFNLLVSDCATKVFLFPQVHLPAAGSHLSTWECGGYFVYNARSEFDSVSEADLSKRLAAASLDDEGFQSLKQLCCSIAIKMAP